MEKRAGHRTRKLEIQNERVTEFTIHLRKKELRRGNGGEKSERQRKGDRKWKKDRGGLKLKETVKEERQRERMSEKEKKRNKEKKKT